jgi:hypothetical protein
MAGVETVPLIWQAPPTVPHIDKLAAEFLRREARTAEAYRIAIALDERLEVMRERLVLCVEQFGRVNGEKKLVGTHYEIVVTFPTVTMVFGRCQVMRADPPVLQVRSR